MLVSLHIYIAKFCSKHGYGKPAHLLEKKKREESAGKRTEILKKQKRKGLRAQVATTTH